MHTRKAMMADMADGFIALPWRPGHFEELFQSRQLGATGMHGKPIGLLNVEHILSAAAEPDRHRHPARLYARNNTPACRWRQTRLKLLLAHSATINPAARTNGWTRKAC